MGAKQELTMMCCVMALGPVIGRNGTYSDDACVCLNYHKHGDDIWNTYDMVSYLLLVGVVASSLPCVLKCRIWLFECLETQKQDLYVKIHEFRCIL